MTNKSEILNAQITNIYLGYEDHGILTFGLSLNIADGTSCPCLENETSKL